MVSRVVGASCAAVAEGGTASGRSVWARFARRVAVLTGLFWVLSVPNASAQYLALSLSDSTISFPSADPDTTPVLTADAVTLTYTVFLSGGANWRITIQASGDFQNGPAVIPASSVTWTASPSPPFRSGVLSATVAQTMASGAGDVLLQRTGTAVFSIPNSWSYDVGTYTTSIVFTLSCP